MAPPPVALFLTTIASQPALRQRQEYLLRVLQVKKIPFTSYDLASDEDAKNLWRRKAPLDKQQLPGILVGNQFPGTFVDFEEAVECEDLDTFLKLKENYTAPEDEKPSLIAKPVGVPGAYSPSQMHPKYKPSPSPSPAPSPLRTKGRGSDKPLLGEQLSEFGLHDVDVSVDDLRALVQELGLGGEEASDLVEGLSGHSKPATTKSESVASDSESKKVQPPIEEAKGDPEKEPEAVKAKENPKTAEKTETELETQKKEIAETKTAEDK